MQTLVFPPQTSLISKNTEQKQELHKQILFLQTRNLLIILEKDISRTRLKPLTVKGTQIFKVQSTTISIVYFSSISNPLNISIQKRVVKHGIHSITLYGGKNMASL